MNLVNKATDSRFHLLANPAHHQSITKYLSIAIAVAMLMPQETIPFVDGAMTEVFLNRATPSHGTNRRNEVINISVVHERTRQKVKKKI